MSSGASLQGAGGAALLSTAQATLRQIFPKEQQGLVQTLFILGIVVAPTLGPLVGGYITDNYNWPWVFFVNIPIGLVSAFLVGNYLHDAPGGPKAGKIDLAGIGLLTVGLGSLQYVLEEGQRDDWFDSPAITRLSVLAAVSLIAMLAWELSPRNTSPVVDFRVLKNRDLSAGLVLFLVLGFGLYGGPVHLPAVHSERPPVLADRDGPGAAAGRPGDRRGGHALRPDQQPAGPPR